jgi:hypothetical protein
LVVVLYVQGLVESNTEELLITDENVARVEREYDEDMGIWKDLRRRRRLRMELLLVVAEAQ